MATLQTMGGDPLQVLGLAGNHDAKENCVPLALEAGLNAFFVYNLNFEMLLNGLKPYLVKQRDDVFFSTGTESRDLAQISSYLDKVLSVLNIDCVDAFFVEYISPSDDLVAVGEALNLLYEWKQEGRIRYVGASVHDRTLALELVEKRQIDVLMHRYNMAHRKSEDALLPATVQAGIPVISFTNTRWGSLLKGHTAWMGDVPTAADCYRFVLRHPAVHMAWTSPRTIAELKENLSVLGAGRMLGDEVARWKQYGDLIYGQGTDAFEMRYP